MQERHKPHTATEIFLAISEAMDDLQSQSGYKSTSRVSTHQNTERDYVVRGYLDRVLFPGSTRTDYLVATPRLRDIYNA